MVVLDSVLFVLLLLACSCCSQFWL